MLLYIATREARIRELTRLRGAAGVALAEAHVARFQPLALFKHRIGTMWFILRICTPLPTWLLIGVFFRDMSCFPSAWLSTNVHPLRVHLNGSPNCRGIGSVVDRAFELLSALPIPSRPPGVVLDKLQNHYFCSGPIGDDPICPQPSCPIGTFVCVLFLLVYLNLSQN